MPFDRPDKILRKGFATLGTLGHSLYLRTKAEAKASAELTFIGEQKLEEVRSQLYTYSVSKVEKATGLGEFDFLKQPTTDESYWLNFHGIHEVDLVDAVGDSLGLDRLTRRRILDTTQRPKIEVYDNYLFFSIKSISPESSGELKVEQVSFLLGDHFVISFQEEVGDHFDAIRIKLEEDLGFIRKRKCDYLLVQLLDAILDNYFQTLEKMNTDVAAIEGQIARDPKQFSLLLLEEQSKKAQVLKKSLWAMKEALQKVGLAESQLIRKETQKLYQDVVSNAMAALDETESMIRNLEGLANIYFSSLSQKMNETMNVLTLVATIFIPLTFIAGIYGMNFENMPELRSPNGYFITLGVMALIGVGMIIYFKYRKWF